MISIIALLLLQPVDQARLLRLAGSLDEQQKCAEAEEVYQQALKAGPPSTALFNNLGNHYVACGQPAQAAPYFERLLKANPAHINANLQLARIATDQRQGDRALGYLSRIPGDSPALALLRAEASYRAGRRDAALSALERIGSQARGDSRVLFSLGLTLARLELYERAESAFQEVLAREPADFDVLFNLGRAAARAGHLERARKVLDVALVQKPEDADALFEAARVRNAQTDYDGAILLLVKARKLAPKRPDILLELARAAADARYFGDSALAYDEYIALRPEDDEVRRDRAVIYGRIERAAPHVGLRELNRYLERHPNDPLGHYDLALIFAFTDLEKAIGELGVALRLDPNLAEAHYARAMLMHRLGKTAEGVPDLEAALRINPRDARSLDQLGLAYLTLEKPAEAEKVLRRAQAISPDRPETLMHLGRALLELGQEQEALVLMERFRGLRSNERVRGTSPWLIEAAGMAPQEASRRVIERLREQCRTRNTDPEVRFQLGKALLSDGRPDEAAAPLREMLALNAGPDLIHNGGALLLRFEQYPLAREFLERAAREKPAASLDLARVVLAQDGPRAALDALGAPLETGDYYLLKARLLETAGDRAGAEQVLRLGLDKADPGPEVARDAAFLLLRLERGSEGLALLGRVLRREPENPDLLLARAVVLGLTQQAPEAEKALKRIQARWPEWDYPYVVHGLLLESRKPAEARQKFQTALALGTRPPAARCALERLSGAAAQPQCACWKGLRELAFGSCGD